MVPCVTTRPPYSTQSAVHLFLLCVAQIFIFKNIYLVTLGLLGSDGSDGKKICLQCRRPGFDPWVGKIPWRREWQPTPVFLPGESHEQRSLAGYSPGGHKELNTTYQLKNNNLPHRLLLPLRFFHEQFLTNLTQSTSLCPLRHGKYL